MHARPQPLKTSLVSAERHTVMVADEELARRAHSIRRTVLEIALGAGTCHIGCALSIVDVLTVLYCDVLREPAAGGDRFLLSKGHAASASTPCSPRPACSTARR